MFQFKFSVCENYVQLISWRWWKCVLTLFVYIYFWLISAKETCKQHAPSNLLAGQFSFFFLFFSVGFTRTTKSNNAQTFPYYLTAGSKNNYTLTSNESVFSLSVGNYTYQFQCEYFVSLTFSRIKCLFHNTVLSVK